MFVRFVDNIFSLVCKITTLAMLSIFDVYYKESIRAIFTKLRHKKCIRRIIRRIIRYVVSKREVGFFTVKMVIDNATC